MKTETLLSLLATDVAPVQRHAASRRMVQALLLGLPFVIFILLSGPVLLPRFVGHVLSDFDERLLLPMFWVKTFVPLAVAVAGFVMARRLARPGVRIGARWLGAVLPVAALWLLAVFVLFDAAPADRTDLLMGHTARTCALSIVLFSVPVFATALAALRSLAPTQPALAGAAAGAMASGIGATVYALQCPELAAPFLAVWYVLGMAIPVVVGALIGPRLLRW